LRELNDTLEQRVAERTAALGAQQRLYQSVTDNASVALFISDQQHRCTFMNPAAEQLTGFSMEQCRGRVLRELLRCSNAAMNPVSSTRPRTVARHHPSGKPRKSSFTRDGHPYDVALTVSALFDEHGAPSGTIMEAQDISQRKRAQAQLNDADRRKDEFLADTGPRAAQSARTGSQCGALPAPRRPPKRPTCNGRAMSSTGRPRRWHD
jgi:PAS domain S-box-containing protein